MVGSCAHHGYIRLTVAHDLLYLMLVIDGFFCFSCCCRGWHLSRALMPKCSFYKVMVDSHAVLVVISTRMCLIRCLDVLLLVGPDRRQITIDSYSVTLSFLAQTRASLRHSFNDCEIG